MIGIATGVRRLAAALLVTTCVVLSACGDDDKSGSDTTSDSVSDTTERTTTVNTTVDSTRDSTATSSAVTDAPSPTPTPTVATEGIIDFGQGKTPRDYDQALDAAFADITQYWSEEFPVLYGVPFEPVSGIYALYPERADLPPSCEGPIPYSEVEGNAFYTSCGDVIVYDDAQLLPELVDKMGVAAVAVVAAHEYGHALQARSGVFDMGLPTVDTEQQADCFAGAWTAHVARGESEQLQFGDADIKAGLAAMIEVRDDPGSDVFDPNGHGTAFDRVGAFQEGFINGDQRCKDFIDNPNPRVDLVFTGADLETGGDLPWEDIVALLPPALDTFWLPLLESSGIAFESPSLVGYPTDGPYPDCDGRADDEMREHAVFCAESNTIAVDEDWVFELYSRLGDLSFGYPIAAAYGDAVQSAIGTGLEGEPRVLLNDCLVGAWVVDIIPVAGTDPPEATNPNQEILLSAGDLDEVVITAVSLGDEATDTDVNGTAFEKIDAFRSGVLGGLDACQNRIG